MLNQDDYMACTNRPRFDIDQDISVEMTTNRNLCYVSIYNDRNNKSIAFQVTKDKIKGLADFFSRNLGRN